MIHPLLLLIIKQEVSLKKILGRTKTGLFAHRNMEKEL
jgi:hypothetical protein